MAITISEETRQQFKAAYFTAEDIIEIEKNALNENVVKNVSDGAAFLRGNGFNTEQMIEIATRGTISEAVYETIHESTKLVNAGVLRREIIELSINASSRHEVQDFLKIAQQVREDELSPDAMRELKEHLLALKHRFCPQSAKPSIAAAQKPPAEKAVG